MPSELDEALVKQVTEVNEAVEAAFAKLPWDHPVGQVRWVHIDQVQANDYNPNSVAFQEMRLLYVSIEQDGYTQPVVAIWDPDAGPDGQGRYVIVDGFHRFSVMKAYPDIYEQTRGYLPVVVLHKSVADRIASTVRHNRARGKHSIAGMGNLVFQLLKEGKSDTDICKQLGMEAEELSRLKHITGYSKLYAEQATYSKPVLTTAQLKAKAKYKEAHPDEKVPTDF